MERAPTRLGTQDWAHTTHQPRSRSPSIVDMLKTRNSWLLPPSIVNDAPRTIGRSGFLKAHDGRKHTKDEQENPHGNLQSRSGLSRQSCKISGSQTQIAIQVFYSRIRDGPPRGPLAKCAASYCRPSSSFKCARPRAGPCSGRASTKKKFRKSRKVFIFNLPRTFAIVRLLLMFSFSTRKNG
jgi:hypothetical protein